MRLIIFPLLLGMGAMFAVVLGFFFAARVSLLVREEFGPEWAIPALVLVLLGVAGLAAAIFRWQSRLTGVLGIGGHAPPDVLYCQTCGTPAAPSAIACAQCGGLRFALSLPGTASETRWHVQVGMDVIGSDERPVGVVKRRRVTDFLVSRPLQRDVYVPFSAIAHAKGREVHLSVPTDTIGTADWTRSPLFNRPG